MYLIVGFFRGPFDRNTGFALRDRHFHILYQNFPCLCISPKSIDHRRAQKQAGDDQICGPGSQPDIRSTVKLIINLRGMLGKYAPGDAHWNHIAAGYFRRIDTVGSQQFVEIMRGLSVIAHHRSDVIDRKTLGHYISFQCMTPSMHNIH